MLRRRTIGALALLVALVFTGSGCQKFLDIQPKGQVIPSTYEDYDRLMNSYEVLKSGSHALSYMLDDALVPLEDIFVELPAKARYEQNLYGFQPIIYEGGENDALWSGSYRSIYNYNVIIDGVGEARDADSHPVALLAAQARVARAYEYLNLLVGFSKAYDPASAGSDPGVPLILKADINQEGLTRASVAEVYEQIISDLRAALPLLPGHDPKTPFRASRTAAMGILSRVYLYRGEYEQALRYANESLAGYDYLLDYNTWVQEQPDPADPTATITACVLPDGRNNGENLFCRFNDQTMSLSFSVYASDDLVAQYDANDLRMTANFSLGAELGMPLDHYLYFTNSTRPNIGLDVPEVLLTAAECEARVGDFNRAVSLVNRLLEHRMATGSFSPVVAGDGEEALRIVLRERRREFPMSSTRRLADLKRLNKDPRFAKQITHETLEGPVTLEPNSPRYQLPIPLEVLRHNPDMAQNPR